MTCMTMRYDTAEACKNGRQWKQVLLLLKETLHAAPTSIAGLAYRRFIALAGINMDSACTPQGVLIVMTGCQSRRLYLIHVSQEVKSAATADDEDLISLAIASEPDEAPK